VNAWNVVRVFLIGPALLGLVHLTGSILANDVTQIVRKRPAAVYADLSSAIAVSPLSGTMQLEGGKPVPYRVHVDRTPGERLILHMMLDGREAGQVDVAFAPENGGEATLMTARVDSVGKVIREELAGTDKAKLGYAPDWVFNFAIRGTLKELAAQIEQGTLMAQTTRSFMDGAEGGMSTEEREQREAWRQYNATRPTTDPNAAAEQYLSQ
jgi:hypothetical protein